MKHFVFWVMLSSFLQSCSTPPMLFNKDAAYRQKSALRLKVKTVDIVNSYVAPEKPPYIDHLIPYSLAESLTEWGHHRLQASARQGFAVVTIEQGSITRKALPIKKGLMDTFTRFPSTLLEGIASVRIDFMDYKGYPVGHATAKTKQSLTLLENTLIADQEVSIQNLSKTIVDAIDQEIEKSLRRHAKTILL